MPTTAAFGAAWPGARHSAFRGYLFLCGVWDSLYLCKEDPFFFLGSCGLSLRGLGFMECALGFRDMGEW